MEEEMPKTNLASFLHRPWYRRSGRMLPLRSARADEPRGGLGRVWRTVSLHLFSSVLDPVLGLHQSTER
jgi:hypothetical protein